MESLNFLISSLRFDANESMMADQRKGWIEEKERLILFQKQLQLNYIQVPSVWTEFIVNKS